MLRAPLANLGQPFPAIQPELGLSVNQPQWQAVPQKRHNVKEPPRPKLPTYNGLQEWCSSFNSKQIGITGPQRKGWIG